MIPDGTPTRATAKTVSYETLAPFLTCHPSYKTIHKIARATKIPYHRILTAPIVKATGFMLMTIIIPSTN